MGNHNKRRAQTVTKRSSARVALRNDGPGPELKLVDEGGGDGRRRGKSKCVDSNIFRIISRLLRRAMEEGSLVKAEMLAELVPL